MLFTTSALVAFVTRHFHPALTARRSNRRRHSAGFGIPAAEVLEVRVMPAADRIATVLATPDGTTTNEDGTQITIRVKLNRSPTGLPLGQAKISVKVSDSSEASVNVAQLTFDDTNWDTWQDVVVTGVDDNDQDGDIWYQFSTYFDIFVPIIDPSPSTRLDLLNIDNDSKVKLTPLGPGQGTLPNYAERGSARWTTEDGSVTHTFTLSLSSAPAASVTVPLASNNTLEGTISVSSVTFTPANWGPRSVVVTGVDDSARDGDQAYSIITGAAVSTDPAFNGFDPADVSLINVDNEQINGNGAGQLTAENGGQASSFVSCASKPAGNVNVAVTVSDATEGVIISGATLTFTPENWDMPQYVTVAGVDDSDIDGDISYLLQFVVSAPGDPVFNGGVVDDVQLVNQDDDTLSITVSGGSVVEGGAITFTITVTAPSSWTGTLVLSASTMGSLAQEGTDYTGISGVNLTFNSSTLTQTITINTIDDSDMEGDEDFYLWLSVVSGGPVDPMSSAMMMASGTIWDNDFTMP